MTRSSFAPELSATFKRVSCWTTVYCFTSRERIPGPPRNRRFRGVVRRVSCWTTLSRLFHDLEHAPALLLGDGARLGDADEVADAALVLGVVDLETRALLDSLAVQAVGLRGADLDDDGLVHLVADHGAEADLAPAACLRLRSRGRGSRCGGVAHSASSFLARPRRFGLGTSSDSASGGTAPAPPAATAATSPVSGEEGSSIAGPMPKSRSRSTVMMRAMSCRTFEIWLEFSSWPTACLKRSSYSSRRAVRRRTPSSSGSR